MNQEPSFERIKSELSYQEIKKYMNDKCNLILNHKEVTSYYTAINTFLYYYADDVIEENGMERVMTMVLAFVYVMEHDFDDPDLAFAVNWHIGDFEVGNYEDLFEKEDLELLKKDIERIKEYLKEYFKKHPEILEEEVKTIEY